MESIKGLVLDKKVIKYRSKLREFNRKYERDNNSKLDNGVYVQGANGQETKKAVPLTKTTGVKGEKEDKARQQGSGRLGKINAAQAHHAIGIMFH